ncbi:MAG: uroporphyrinogen-III C-methyltransferase [Chitinophagaceae bacterium]|nr:uroporphyrinogen-III C-methyltransferase [Chitinophagaceae bacterium]
MEVHTNPVGKVILAAAGPGDPELVTLKTVKYLQQADVILTDRLVSDEIIRQWANPGAIVTYVGKQCRRGNSTPQETINELLIEHAYNGKLVVRLKGGDSSIFSNILDELETVQKYNIPFEIVPGVTAALGAAAYAGMPLTARGYSTAVRFLTYYKSDVLTDDYWRELANTTDTLVFYMSSETLDTVIDKLIFNQISNECHVAVIEQATTPHQNIYTSNIYTFNSKFKNERFVSPSIVVIGKVVSLTGKFNWVGNSNSKESYFKTVAPLSTNSTNLNKKSNVNRA